MKKKVFLMLLTLSIIYPEQLLALNFTIEYTYAGQTLIYYVNNMSKTCSVYSPPEDKELSGRVIIPDTVTYNNVKYPVTAISNYAFRDCKKITSISMPNSITKLGEYSFDSCSGLTSIEIPSSITALTSNAFINCTGLTEIKLPNTLTSIGTMTFADCTDLTSIDLPESLTIIGEGSFSGSGLRSVKIPNSITTINLGTFSYCESLSSVELPNSVIDIRSGAFRYCSALTSIKIPDSVTYIGDSAFFYCSNLSDLLLGNSVDHIGVHAFSECPKLKSIKIPESLTSLSAWAWGPEIEEVEYLTQKPCSSVYDVFYGDVYEKATLYILKGTKDIFMKTEPWMYFKNIKEKDASSIDCIISDDKSEIIDFNSPYNIYSINGISMGNDIKDLNTGIYIIQQGMKTQKYIKL